MRDSIVMRDLCCTKKARHQSRQCAFLREQDTDTRTILFAQKLRRERDNGSRLLCGVTSDEKMDAGQLISIARGGLSIGLPFPYRCRLAENFFPGADPCLVEIARFVARII